MYMDMDMDKDMYMDVEKDNRYSGAKPPRTHTGGRGRMTVVTQTPPNY